MRHTHEYKHSGISSSVAVPLDALPVGVRTTSDLPIEIFQHVKNNRKDLVCHFCGKKISVNRRCTYLGINADGDWMFSHIKCFRESKKW